MTLGSDQSGIPKGKAMEDKSGGENSIATVHRAVCDESIQTSHVR